MPQNKPTVLMVIAVLQLVFGGLGLVGSALQLAGGGTALATAKPPQAPGGHPTITAEELENYLARKVPDYRLLMKAQAGASAVLCLLMLGSGVGLLFMQRWGRDVAIFYAVLSLLVTILSTVWMFTAVVPAMSAFAREKAAGRSKEDQIVAQGMDIGGKVGAGCGTLTGIYPLIVLFIMLLPSTEEAFRDDEVSPVELLPDDFPPPSRSPPDESVRPTAESPWGEDPEGFRPGHRPDSDHPR
jgi:hypothetical protein